MLNKIIPFELLETFTVIMYLVPPIISLLALFFLKRKLIWLAIPITVFIDIISFWEGIIYYETQSLALLFLIPQIIVVIIIAFVVIFINRKRV